MVYMKKKRHFRYPKMLSTRVEHSDFDKLQFLFKVRDKSNLQEIINMFVVSYISGTIVLEDNKFVGPKEDPEQDAYDDIRERLKRGEWL